MLNGLQGIPGSGKSYEAVVFHALPALKAGRKVITNLPLLVEFFAALNPDYVPLIELRRRSRPVLGTWDAQRVDENGNGNAFQLFSHAPASDTDEARPIVVDPDARVALKKSSLKGVVFGSVWDYYTEWKHPITGQGPLFIIDESHVPMPKFGTDPEVIEWYKLHRHFNVDVLLATQNFRDMNQEIAGLIAILIKVRKADVLGRKDAYIRKVHAGYRGGLVSEDQRPYKAQFFALYKSHTQGNSVAESGASDVAPLIVKFNRVKYVWFAITALGFLYAFWPSSDEKIPLKVAAVDQVKAAPTPTHHQVAHPPLGAVSAPESPPPVAVDLEPFKDKLIHITGSVTGAKGTVHTFAVSAGGARQFDVVVADLVAAGYVYKPLAPCIGFLHFKDKIRAVTCDAPVLAQGSNNSPVVVDSSTRKTSTSDKVNL